MPIFYRKWAAYRLQSLQPWVRSWMTEHMFAGVPHVGAEDAWWLTSLEIEHAQCTRVSLSGGSADIQKCFDMIVRPLLYTLARIQGMPLQILVPYMKYLEGMWVYNTVVGGLGEGCKRPCGILQGCPLSMMFVALLLRP